MKKQTKKIVIGSLITIAVILALLFVFGVGQSIFSTSSTSFSNGTVYWTITGSGNAYGGETLTFNYKVGSNVNNYPLNDGTGRIVQPKTSMDITISKGDSYCSYPITSSYTQGLYGIGKKEYFILGNPAKTAFIEVKDSNGQVQTVDGSLIQSVTLQDTDDSGSAVVQTQGLLDSKYTCPNYANVAFVVNKDGQTLIVDRTSLEVLGKTTSALDLIGFNTKLNNLPKSSFTNTFSNFSYRLTSGSEFRGYMDIGNVIFTITADQDYFDSVVYTPPKEVKPIITNVDCADTLKSKTSGIQLYIKNTESSTGSVTITASALKGMITPSGTSSLLTTTKTIPFTYTAGSVIGEDIITFKVCSQSQFTSSNCDTYTCKLTITEETPKTFCGDGTCQTNEDATSCSKDCFVDKCGNGICDTGENYISCAVDCKEQPQCKWYQEPTPAYKTLFGFVQKEAGCKTAPWFNVIIVISFLLLVILIYIGFMKAKQGLIRRFRK